MVIIYNAYIQMYYEKNELNILLKNGGKNKFMKKILRCSLPLILSQNKIVYVRLINNRKIKMDIGVLINMII
jgi:hypothetical protein